MIHIATLDRIEHPLAALVMTTWHHESAATLLRLLSEAHRGITTFGVS